MFTTEKPSKPRDDCYIFYSNKLLSFIGKISISSSELLTRENGNNGHSRTFFAPGMQMRNSAPGSLQIPVKGYAVVVRRRGEDLA